MLHHVMIMQIQEIVLHNHVFIFHPAISSGYSERFHSASGFAIACYIKMIF